MKADVKQLAIFNFRDHHQISFFTLNIFSSKKAIPLFLTDNIKMDGIPTKIKYKYIPFLHCISSFEGTPCKNL